MLVSCLLLCLGNKASQKKVKGLCLTSAVEPLITKEVMDAQVEHFTLKRRGEPMAGAPPKKECLMVARRRAAAAFNQELNATLQNQDVAACLALQPDSLVSGPCNCVMCSSKTSVTVPQVRFDKKRRDGHIETTSLYKEYRLVMHKRWALPGQTKTWPFGYKL